MKEYYLYRHIRLDKNEVFYIGIGTNNVEYSYYKRANTLYGRNKFWHNIVNKTNYEVEIVIESNNYEFIQQKEIEFIALYGRRDLGKGTLVNMTDGGEGNKNRMHIFKYKAIYVFDKQLNFIGQFQNAKEASIFIYGDTTHHKQITTNCKFGNLTNKKYYVALKERYDKNDIVFKNIRKKVKGPKNNCKSFYYKNKFYETKGNLMRELNISRRRFDILFEKLLKENEIIWK